jgi:hypothetical protein
MEGYDGEADDIDVTHLRSTAKERLIGLQDFGGLRCEVFHDVTDTSHAKMRALKAAELSVYFAITQTDGSISAFAALVKSFTWQAQANNAYRGNTALCSTLSRAGSHDESRADSRCAAGARAREDHHQGMGRGLLRARVHRSERDAWEQAIVENRQERASDHGRSLPGRRAGKIESSKDDDAESLARTTGTDSRPHRGQGARS